MGHGWAAGRRGAKEGLEILKAVNLNKKGEKLYGRITLEPFVKNIHNGCG
jgi:hypothetical protein